MPPRARPVVKGDVVSPLRSDSESPPPLHRRSQTLAEEWGDSETEAPDVRKARVSARRGGEDSQDETDSPHPPSYKTQGRTTRTSYSSRRAQDSSDEETTSHRPVRRDSHLSTPRSGISRNDRARFAVSGDSDEDRFRSGRSERASGLSDKSGKEPRTPDVNRAYLSPPPTQKKPPRVPDTPRGRIPRRSTVPASQSRRRSSDGGHDVYALGSSDDEAVVRVRAKNKKPLPAVDVLNITSDEDLPTRLTTPRKLKFSEPLHEKSPAQNNTQGPEERVEMEDDEDADENGNLRGFVVSDDEEVLRSSSRRHPRKGARDSVIADTRSYEGDDAQEDHSGSSQTMQSKTVNAVENKHGGASRSKTDIEERESKSTIKAATDGVKVDLRIRGRAGNLDGARRKARSPSRDSDDYRPAQKRSPRATVSRREDSTVTGSTKLAKRRERSMTPGEDADVRPAKRSQRAPTHIRRTPSPVINSRGTRRRNRSPSPYYSDEVKPAKRAKKEVTARPRRSPSVDDIVDKKRRRDRSPTPSDGEDVKPAKRAKKSSTQAPSSPSTTKPERSSTKSSVVAQSTSSRPLVKDGKCKITFENDHDGFLVGTYDVCVAYLSSSMLRTPQETGAVGVSHFDNTRNGLPMFEADNLCHKRLRAIITFGSAADGQVINPARADPDGSGVSLSDYTTQNNKTIKSVARKGENVDLVIFAFVAPDGSFIDRLASPSGANAPTNQCYHALHVYPLNGDYQRVLAFLHRTYAPANQQCQMFTTGNAWQATTLWGDRDKYQQKKPLPGHVRLNPGESSSARGSRGVNPALSRVAKNYMADIPVFDSRRHFMLSHVGEDWQDGFSPEKILTQVDGLDERFQGEIPDDSFIALHCVSSMRANGVVSLNLIGAQVLVTPRVVHFSDL